MVLFFIFLTIRLELFNDDRQKIIVSRTKILIAKNSSFHFIEKFYSRIFLLKNNDIRMR